jgi:hypothetical protein
MSFVPTISNSLFFTCPQYLRVSGKDGDLDYIKRCTVLVIQVVKTIFNTYFSALKKKKGRQGLLASLVKARHVPFVFDDYLEVINDLGLVLPVTKDIFTTMPTIYKLLMCNPFSEAENEWSD